MSYAYDIDKYDVTNAQYGEFLNTKDPTGSNTLGLWNNGMANGVYPYTNGVINFNPGNPNGSKYTVISGARESSGELRLVVRRDSLR